MPELAGRAGVLRGSCLCGAVRVEAPAPSLWVAHCHCTMCQRAHGAAFVTWMGLPRERVTIGDADKALRWYASSDDSRRGFCCVCGSTLFFESRRWADELHVVVANLEQGPDRPPQAHAFYDFHVDWFEPIDDLPKRGN